MHAVSTNQIADILHFNDNSNNDNSNSNKGALKFTYHRSLNPLMHIVPKWSDTL